MLQELYFAGDIVLHQKQLREGLHLFLLVEIGQIVAVQGDRATGSHVEGQINRWWRSRLGRVDTQNVIVAALLFGYRRYQRGGTMVQIVVVVVLGVFFSSINGRTVLGTVREGSEVKLC